MHDVGYLNKVILNKTEIIMRTLPEVVTLVDCILEIMLGCLYACIDFGCVFAGILSHSGDHYAHSTRSGKQSEIVWSSHPEEFAW